MSEVRDGRLYTDSHMWVQRMEGAKVRVGMTDHAQSDLGDVVYVDLPKEGREFRKGDEFGAMESVKTVEPIYAPVSGKIVESNKKLEEYPETVNGSPYDDGWMVIIQMSDESELESMMQDSLYAEFVK